MPDQVVEKAIHLLELSPEPVARYRLLRDILSHATPSDEMQAARASAREVKPVRDLLSLQHPDGSWGNRFRIRSSRIRQAGSTMESALIRLGALGLDAEDPAILKSIRCMEEALDGSRRWPDRLDPVIQFDKALDMVIAARLREWSPTNRYALGVADQLLRIIRVSFAPGYFDEAAFLDCTEQITGVRLPADCSICFSIYPLILLRGTMEYELEEMWIRYLVRNRRGIRLLSNRSIEYLPLDFPSQEGMRFIHMLDLLSWFPAAADLLVNAGDWLWQQMNNDGLWDFGPDSRDNLELPLSNSWRNQLNRQIDCSVRALSILNRLQKSCEIRDTLCHPL